MKWFSMWSVDLVLEPRKLTIRPFRGPFMAQNRSCTCTVLLCGGLAGSLESPHNSLIARVQLVVHRSSQRVWVKSIGTGPAGRRTGKQPGGSGGAGAPPGKNRGVRGGGSPPWMGREAQNENGKAKGSQACHMSCSHIHGSPTVKEWLQREGWRERGRERERERGRDKERGV